MSPRISVVVTAYQAGWCIGGALASLLAQTYRDFEMIVVDDGSTDETTAVAAAHGGPLRLFRTEENRGIAAARNLALAEASGELVAFCDADDYFFPRYLEALLGALEGERSFAVSNAWWFFPGGIHRGRRRYKGYRGAFPAPERQRAAILEHNFVSIMSLVPRGLIDEIGPFREELRRVEDWDYWLRAIFAGYRARLQPEPLALFRWGAASMSAAFAEMDAASVRVLTDMRGRSDLTASERDYLDRRLAGPGPRELGRSADDALRAGRYEEAARLYRSAAELVPSERMLVWKARVLSAAPAVTGPAVRARQLAIERRLGFGREHVR